MRESQVYSQEPNKNKPGLGTWIGVAFFVFMGIFSISTGSDLSVGVIFIVIGIILYISGDFKSKNMITGNCPYCGYQVRATKFRLNTKCPACKKLLVIKDKKFLGVD